MNLIEELKKLGVDVDEGLGRVMGDSSLYEMMLGMFVDAVRDNPVSVEDFSDADLDDLVKRIHMLKGVTGNLALTPLFNGYKSALVLLRAGKAADAKAEFERMLPVQVEFIDCIKRYQGA